jgi:hypothetical protein
MPLMIFEDPSSYTFEGTTRDVHECDACGKSGLLRTFILTDSHGETLHLGSECAGNERDVPGAIAGEMRSAVARAVAAGAAPRLEFIGAGMTGIVLSDGKYAYKVARHDPGVLAEEAEWFVDAARTPFVKDHVPKHVRWNAQHGVLVRDFVDGRPGRWGDESRLFDLHRAMEKHMLKAGWSMPEFKGDSYIIAENGHPILVDGSLPSRVGKNLVRYVEDALAGRRTPRESMSDLAFALRREIIAKHNPHGTIPAKDVLRLLKQLREAGVNFDPSWERVDA